MGQCVQQVIAQDPEIMLVAKLERGQGLDEIFKGLCGGSYPLRHPVFAPQKSGTPPTGSPASKLPLIPLAALDQKLLKDLVWIDFSSPQATMEYLSYCRRHKVPMVIGTTGFSEAEKNLIAEGATDIPVLCSANMSVGMNLLFKALSFLRDQIPAPLSAGIIDLHHAHKKDAPSGTALTLAKIIQGTGADSSTLDTVSIASLRMGTHPGTHTVIFSLPGEQLSFSHQAEDRLIFARGALRAAQWLVHQPPGLYDMQAVLA